ncbi:MAG: 2-oxo acid dehydrogenase subunit E2 [Candidatus Sericytochromatia bacterium]|nr:2-oxo acid dehydrogenase subunit E2 [Candidatus Tanganyikabacteria bacterium]
MLAEQGSARRKLALVSWDGPGQPAILGKITVDATEALAYLDDLRARTGVRATLTHLVAKAVLEAIAGVPRLNTRLVLGRFLPNPDPSVSVLVALSGGADLARFKIDGGTTRSVEEIALACERRVSALRSGADRAHQAGSGVIKVLPAWLLGPVIRALGYLAGAMGIPVPPAGLEPMPFGSCIISNVGVFGVEEAFIPLMHWSHVPVYVCVGAVRDLPAAVDGEVCVRPQMVVTATIDHRYVDGAQAARFAGIIKAVLDDPWRWDAARPGRADARAAATRRLPAPAGR